jgi:precorrin-6B methylase 2
MILSFDRDMTRMDVHANGTELAAIMGMDRDERGERVHTYPRDKSMYVTSFDQPVLATDTHRIAALGEQDPVLRDTVFALYGTGERITEYDGTRLAFVQDEYPGVWGPSIDTIVLCRALEDLDRSQVETAVEIGAGSGFVTKRLLERTPSLERATMVDMNPTAIKACRDAVTDERARFHTGDGMEFLQRHDSDLVICNPPYIPRPRAIGDNAYEGIGLIVDLIERAGDYLTADGRLLINISSLCMHIARRVLHEADADFRQLDTLDVPLKVYNVLNNQLWLDYLLDECNLVEERRQGYDYWQTLHILEVTP